jgi:uncharacterized protein (DUF1015 family)
VAVIHAFRALRPAPPVAAKVAAVPYDVVSRSEAAALANENPLSFLHVSRAEIDLAASTDPYHEDVYRAAVDSFRRLRRAAPLVQEDDPSLYVYRLSMGGHEQTGVAGCFSIDEYERDVIKKHERTRRDKEDDRTRHMLMLRAQTGPVFLVYRTSALVDVIVARATSDAPLFDFTAIDGVRHTIWRVVPATAAALTRAFATVPALYIADGHHRAASAARARRELRSGAMHAAAELAQHAGIAEHDTFLAVAFPASQVRILPYNRVVRDLGGRSPAAFLEVLANVARVTPRGPATPASKGDVSMFLDGQWYTLALGVRGGRGEAHDGLDVSLLQDRVIGPLLGVHDVRTDKRIDFVGGVRGSDDLERLVRRGDAAVAFAMFPVTTDDLMAIVDAGGIMPPKSTWFEPKLRDGLLSHLI